MDKFARTVAHVGLIRAKDHEISKVMADKTVRKVTKYWVRFEDLPSGCDQRLPAGKLGVREIRRLQEWKERSTSR